MIICEMLLLIQERWELDVSVWRCGSLTGVDLRENEKGGIGDMNVENSSFALKRKREMGV